MSKYQKRLELLRDQELLLLEEQKNSEKFSSYIKAILTRRYLNKQITLDSLVTKLEKSSNDFQKNIIWSVLSIRFIKEEKDEEIKKVYHVIQQMPIEYLARLSEEASSKYLKEKANELFYQKQLELEEELGLSQLEYEKWLLDYAIPEEQDYSTIKMSKKDLLNNSIPINMFLKRYYDIECQNPEQITHQDMEEIIRINNIPIPKRGSLQHIGYEDIATSKWVLVRDKSNTKKSNRIIPYLCPLPSSVEYMKEELGISYKKQRK